MSKFFTVKFEIYSFEKTSLKQSQQEIPLLIKRFNLLNPSDFLPIHATIFALCYEHNLFNPLE